ncbi:MAG: hypothetical protein K2Y33_11795 [Mycolicibacterium frederiksbergense]|nr:hypothetical protein [Mycolicibacterium frederiksbergense]
MADHYISWVKGDGLSPANITAGTSSTGADHVELRTLDGAGLTKLDVQLALDAFQAYYATKPVTP